MLQVTFVRREETAKDIFTFWFKPEKPVQYIAGQFTELYLPHEGVDNRGPRRWFTLSSSPTDELVSITTRLVPADGSSFKRELFKLPPGAQLGLADPMGDFVLPKSTSIPLVFVAAGLGITPVHSMVKWLHDTGEQRRVHLMYAVRHLEEVAWLELFRDYPLQLTLVVKQPAAEYDGETGSLTTERILQLADDDESYIYLSGPEPMTERFYKEMTARGIANERLITDYFPGYTQF